MPDGSLVCRPLSIYRWEDIVFFRWFGGFGDAWTTSLEGQWERCMNRTVWRHVISTLAIVELTLNLLVAVDYIFPAIHPTWQRYNTDFFNDWMYFLDSCRFHHPTVQEGCRNNWEHARSLTCFYPWVRRLCWFTSGVNVLSLLFALSSIEFMQRGIAEEALLVSLSSPLMVLNAVDAGVNHQSVQRQDAHISKRIIDLLTSSEPYRRPFKRCRSALIILISVSIK